MTDFNAYHFSTNPSSSNSSGNSEFGSNLEAMLGLKEGTIYPKAQPAPVQETKSFEQIVAFSPTPEELKSCPRLCEAVRNSFL